MAEDPRNVRVPGRAHFHIAPIGTTMPTGPATLSDFNLDPAFRKVGYSVEDATNFAKTNPMEPIEVHQEDDPVRYIPGRRETRLTTTFREWNSDVFLIALGGGEVTHSGGAAQIHGPEAGAIYEFSFICDVFDGAYSHRWGFERMVTTSDFALNLSKRAAADLPVTLTALAPGGGRPTVIEFSNDTTSFPVLSA